jgi:hypothetical protein
MYDDYVNVGIIVNSRFLLSPVQIAAPSKKFRRPRTLMGTEANVECHVCLPTRNARTDA